jgi:hypothetical protein
MKTDNVPELLEITILFHVDTVTPIVVVRTAVKLVDAVA